jgi:two-component system sensor histidine kinase KdpD
MDRPDPDELLDKIQREEDGRRRGRLKIFFGASAGVGKTYAMLQAARREREGGTDVGVGIVETHGREQTTALLEGLEILSPATHEYRGRRYAEFDLDAALARRPQLVLVDELAHSNVRGSRHSKRWQDVHELLDAGIDVYSTLNVQHLESLNDIVGRIAGIRVRETVPDRIFDLADEVALVDLPPDELLERLREGKIYLPSQAESAVRNFFRKGNLIALRELALRRTADRVDAQMREYRADQSIDRVWQAHERIIVCVGPGREAGALVRAGARLAASLKADWLAVYIETPRLQRLADEARKRTFDALRLAAELGAEVVTLQGEDVVRTLVAYAQVRNVSRLVAGAPAPSSAWGFMASRSVGERLARAAHDVEVTLVRPEAAAGGGRQPARQSIAAFAADSRRSAPAAYGWAVLACAVPTLAAGILAGRIAPVNLVMLYLLGAIFTAVRLGRGPGVLYSFLAVAVFDYFFVPPFMSFTVSDTQYLLTFAVMLLVSLTISHLAAGLRRQAQNATLRERRTGAMFAMTRELGAALTMEQIIGIGTRHVAEIFQARVAILLPDSAEQVRQKVRHPDAALMLEEAAIDHDIAQWVYDRQEPAGRGTDTLPAAAALYLPLKAPMRTRGVLALACGRMEDLAIPERRQMLYTFAAQIALAIERVHYVEIAQDALVSMESERLRNSLLAAISHDLRTPLTSIVGFASLLAGQAGSGAAAQQPWREIAEAIHEEALRMTSLVTNLLDMARLQDGSMRLNLQWSSIEEVIGSALAGARRLLAGRAVATRVPPGFPLLRLDPVLVERMLANLLENALKYTPEHSPLEIDVAMVQADGRRYARVEVLDQGPGLPAGMAARLFDKFTRGEKESSKPGIGLGLAICSAIVQAHGGRIGAADRSGAGGRAAGACFWFMLPADETAPMDEDLAAPLPWEDGPGARDVAAGDPAAGDPATGESAVGGPAS